MLPANAAAVLAAPVRPPAVPREADPSDAPFAGMVAQLAQPTGAAPAPQEPAPVHGDLGKAEASNPASEAKGALEGRPSKEAAPAFGQTDPTAAADPAVARDSPNRPGSEGGHPTADGTPLSIAAPANLAAAVLLTQAISLKPDPLTSNAPLPAAGPTGVSLPPVPDSPSPPGTVISSDLRPGPSEAPQARTEATLLPKADPHLVQTPTPHPEAPGIAQAVLAEILPGEPTALISRVTLGGDVPLPAMPSTLSLVGPPPQNLPVQTPPLATAKPDPGAEQPIESTRADGKQTGPMGASPPQTTGHFEGPELLAKPTPAALISVDASSLLAKQATTLPTSVPANQTILGSAQAVPFTPASIPVAQVEGGFRWMVKTGAQEAQIQLHPESLGQVTIHLRVEGGEVHAQLWIVEPGTVQAMQDGKAHLAQSLKEQGLQLGSFDLHQGHRPFQEPSHAPVFTQDPALPPAPARQEAPLVRTASFMNPHRIELYA